MPCQQILTRDKSKNVMELPEEALMLIRQYEESKADEEEGSARKDDAINKLKEMLGVNEIGKVGEYVIFCKNVKEEIFDSELFKVDNPDLYAKYLRHSSYQRLNIE